MPRRWDAQGNLIADVPRRWDAQGNPIRERLVAKPGILERMGGAALQRLADLPENIARLGEPFLPPQTQEEARVFLVGGPGALASQRVIIDPAKRLWSQAKEEAARGETGRAVSAGVAGAIPIAGPMLHEMSERIGAGEGPEVAGETAVDVLTAKYLPKVTGPAVKKIGPGKVGYNIPRLVIKEAAGLPQRALKGSENVFRAAAPVGTDPGFRASVYTAAGDLAEIGRKVKIADAKGGWVRPDMRPRAVINAIREHLDEMYQNERSAQILRNSEFGTSLKLGRDATDGLDLLSKNAGSGELKDLATKGLNNKVLTLQETDKLARLVNKELLKFEGATAEQQAAALATNPRIGNLKALDREITALENRRLRQLGEPGVAEYERRYAALSHVRIQLQKRMNMAELQRRTPWGGARAKLGFGPRAQLAGASQAAVAELHSIGRTLQRGLNELAASGIKAKRGVGIRPQRALPAGPRPGALPSEPTGPLAPPPYVAPGTTPERMGRLLPAAGETTQKFALGESEPLTGPKLAESALGYEYGQGPQLGEPFLYYPETREFIRKARKKPQKQ